MYVCVRVCVYVWVGYEAISPIKCDGEPHAYVCVCVCVCVCA